jgi:predicted dehydrogenase
VVRLAIIGGGFGASHYWQEHPNCKVVAVTDLLEQRRQRLIERYNCKNVFRSMEEMFEKASDTFDAVGVFSNASSHSTHSVMCMEAGKDVVSAVPIALTLKDCVRVKEAAERTGRKYMLFESSYYRHPCIAARELYQAGEFGKLAYSEVEYYHIGLGGRVNSAAREYLGLKSWRFGLPPMLYPTHSLGLIVGVTGERILKVSCLGNLVGDDFPKAHETPYNNPYNNEMAIGITNQNNICRFGCFWNVAANGERGQWLGEKLSCYMSGSGGQPTAKKTPRGKLEPWQVPEYWQTDRLPEPMRHRSGHGGSSTFLSHEFISAILEDRSPLINIYEALAMNVPGLIAHESALKGGVQLDVPNYDPPGYRSPIARA